jgi:hypothetical protein
MGKRSQMQAPSVGYSRHLDSVVYISLPRSLFGSSIVTLGKCGIKGFFGCYVREINLPRFFFFVSEEN